MQSDLLKSYASMQCIHKVGTVLRMIQSKLMYRTIHHVRDNLSLKIRLMRCTIIIIMYVLVPIDKREGRLSEFDKRECDDGSDELMTLFDCLGLRCARRLQHPWSALRALRIGGLPSEVADEYYPDSGIRRRAKIM